MATAANKGAFNEVNNTSLEARLRAKGILTIGRQWIHSFMENRHASIAFDDFETQPSLLENAGLAQGSPLSPILFTFFNSDLVKQPVDAKGGASAFIDDYFRWRVGPSAEENLRKLQEDDIPRIEAWARQTGSCCAAEKTADSPDNKQESGPGTGKEKFRGQTGYAWNDGLLRCIRSENHKGAAPVALNEGLQASESRQVSIRSMEHWSVYAAELMAIIYAISLVLHVTQKRQGRLDRVKQPAAILSDGMSVLQAIRNPPNKSGQQIIRAILQAASEMKARGIPIRLQWVPGHCDDPGNDEADRLAKEA
ncbi:hypothetical protein ABHI18_012161, partial [Aspergillus niger]